MFNILVKCFCVLLLTISAYTSSSAQRCNDLFEQWEYAMDTSYNFQFAIDCSKELIPQVDDSCKILIYYRLGNVFLEMPNADSAEVYINVAKKMSEAAQSEVLIIKGQLMDAALANFRNNIEEAKKILAKVGVLLAKIPEHKQLWLKYYHEMGSVANSEADYETAISFSESIIEGKYYRDSIELASNYHNIGLFHLRLSDYESASENLLKAIDINTQIAGGDLMANFLVLGYALGTWEQYETGITYLKKGIALSRKNKNDPMSLRLYITTAGFYRILEEEKKALNAIDSAFYFLETIDNSFELSKAFLEKGKIYNYLLDNPQKAEFFYTQARDQSKKTHTFSMYAPAMELLKFNLKRKNLLKSKTYLEELKDICESLNRLDYDVEYYKQSSTYYQLTGEYEKALSFYKRFHELNDSIANRDVLSRVAGMERKYNSKQKEIDILRLNQEKKQQSKLAEEATFFKKMYGGIAVLLGILAFAVFYFAQKFKKQNTSLGAAHSKLRELNQVKDRLFSIIAHDIRGMIIPFQRAGKVLTYHLEKGNNERAIMLSAELEKNSENLSTMLDNLLKWSLEQMDGYDLKSEPLHIRKELEDIMQGFSQHASYKNNILEIVPSEDEIIIFDKGAFHVIFRNLVGNALKFTEAGIISADWQKTDDELRVVISDTGIGIPPEQKRNLFDLNNSESLNGTAGEKGTGLGLHLVDQFTAKLNGQIKVISKVGQGSQFILTFPRV